MDKLALKFQFAESMSGADQELLLVLRKAGDETWGDAADYTDCIRRIAANEEALVQSQPGAKVLSVKACFAGSDVMSGKKGQEYFEACWRGVGGRVEFESQTFEGVDHDGVLVDLGKGPLRGVFERVGRGGAV